MIKELVKGPQGLILAAVLLLLYVGVPALLGSNNYLMGIVVPAMVIAGIALAWALLGNLGGMVSFGHAAFFGVGGYASALLTMKLGVPVLLAIPLAGVIAALASVCMMPTLRLRGPYFALAILAFAEIFRILATEWRWLTGGAGGIQSIPSLPVIAGVDLGAMRGYFVILTLLFLGALAYRLIRRSSYGLALLAMHETEDATRVLGVNSTLLKAAMLLVSAFMTGVIGAFNAHFINFLEPDYAFSGAWTSLAIVAAIFGGYRTVSGPLIGAVVIYLADQLIFKEYLPQGHQIILGIVLGLMILFSPSGMLPSLMGLKNRLFLGLKEKADA